MKRIIFVLLAFLVCGCAAGKEKFEYYRDNPKALINDPNYADYREKRDILENKYLQKEITYADYVQGMDALDEEYSKGLQETNKKMSQ